MTLYTFRKPIQITSCPCKRYGKPNYARLLSRNEVISSLLCYNHYAAIGWYCSHMTFHRARSPKISRLTLTAAFIRFFLVLIVTCSLATSNLAIDGLPSRSIAFCRQLTVPSSNSSIFEIIISAFFLKALTSFLLPGKQTRRSTVTRLCKHHELSAQSQNVLIGWIYHISSHPLDPHTLSNHMSTLLSNPSDLRHIEPSHALNAPEIKKLHLHTNLLKKFTRLSNEVA